MKLQELLKAYVELNKLYASPGDKCHMLASCIAFLQRQILAELKKDLK